MKGMSFCLTVAVLLAPVHAASQTVDPNRILLQARGKVVHLMVKGTAAPGENFSQPIHGSGVIIRTTATQPAKRFRVLTAGHVVKADSAWAPLGSRFNRDVYVIGEYGPGTIEFRPVTGVTVNDQRDIAQVVANPNTALAADVKFAPLSAGQYYVVVSWGLDGAVVAENAIAKLVKIIGPDTIDPDLIKLEGELLPTESGSPVLDDTGAVVAIVVMREISGSDSRIALALPLTKVANWINGIRSNPVVEPPRQQIQAVREAAGLCVFLGKASALNAATLNYPDAPFGRALLQQVRNAAIANPMLASLFLNELSEVPLRIAAQTGAINIRSRCPEVRNGKAFYGSVVAQLTPRSQIKVGSVQPLRYLDDTFYWATVTQIIPPQ
jgi:Trypsin-like peptidase domain